MQNSIQNKSLTALAGAVALAVSSFVASSAMAAPITYTFVSGVDEGKCTQYSSLQITGGTLQITCTASVASGDPDPDPGTGGDGGDPEPDPGTGGDGGDPEPDPGTGGNTGNDGDDTPVVAGGINMSVNNGIFGGLIGSVDSPSTAPKVGRNGGKYHYYKLNIPAGSRTTTFMMPPFNYVQGATLNMWFSKQPGGEPVEARCAASGTTNGASITAYINNETNRRCNLETGVYYLNVGDGVGGSYDWSNPTCTAAAGCGYRFSVSGWM